MEARNETVGHAPSAETDSAGHPPVSVATGNHRHPRDGRQALRALIDDYMAQYAGKDPTRPQRLGFWIERLGDMPIGDLTDDDVADALDALAKRRGRYFMGLDADGQKIFKLKDKAVSPATVNRVAASLAAVFKWARVSRRLPRGWVSPLVSVEKRKEPRGRARFLGVKEIDALLAATKAEKWQKLHLIVAMALTTGCRRGELEGLRWKDINFDTGLASLSDSKTKNGDPREVPLTAPVIEELRRFEGKADALVFASERRPDVAFNFETPWRRSLKAAGIRGFTFHGLRHTAASHLAMSGASMHEVGGVLGHKTPSMSARYSHLSIEHKAALVHRVLGSIGAGK